MLANYVKIAFKVFLRRKFFTFISLFGISFTLLVLMVAVAILDHAFAPFPPEVHQDRTLTVFGARMSGPKSSWGSGAGYKLLDRYARDLPGAERLSIFTSGNTAYSYLAGNKIKSALKRTDAEFWKILQFRFVEGGAFGEEDVREARFVAVVNEATRGKFFGGAPALGKTLELDGQRFQVIGVVADVPSLRQVPFADVWVPFTTAKTSGYRDQLMGGFMGLVLARSAADMPGLKAELRSRLQRFESPDPKEYDKLTASLETKFEYQARRMFGRRDEDVGHPERLWAAIAVLTFLFMLLPTVNLVNLNVSRILERASEIGVRKAFGATSRTLVGQFVVENVLLTLIGGALGLVLSVFVLDALSASNLMTYAQLRLNLRIFLYGMALAIVFGILSGVYPAYRMSRLHPVLALRGGER